MRRYRILWPIVIGLCVGLCFVGDSAARLAPEEAARVWIDILARRDFSEARKVGVRGAEQAALTHRYDQRETAQFVKAMGAYGALLPPEKRKELVDAWLALLRRATVKTRTVTADPLRATVEVTVSRIDARALQDAFFQNLAARRAALRRAGAQSKSEIAVAQADALLATFAATELLDETASFQAECRKRAPDIRGEPQGLDALLLRLRLKGRWEMAQPTAFQQELRKAMLRYE